MRNLFRIFSKQVSKVTGSFGAFLLAICFIIIWLFTGPMFDYSDTWQLIINTSTTIMTFLMVFIIQNTQNRDSKALHLKLDELIKAIKGARTKLLNSEELDDQSLEELRQEFITIYEKYNKRDSQTNGSSKNG